jgi:hypothetical protein
LELTVVRRRRFAWLLPGIAFLALRALSHAHPAPLPWTAGVFDADGLDDLLQAIRIVYSPTGDPHRVAVRALEIPTGTVSSSDVSSGGETFLTAVRSRAPPGPSL